MQRYEPLSFDGGDGPRVDWESGFRLDDHRIAFGLGATVSPRLSDLLDIAVAAYVTDRLRPRRAPRARGSDDWSRGLPVRVAVRDAAFWRRGEVGDVLVDLLEWLTDDAWEVELLDHREQHRFAEVQEPLFGLDHDPGTRFGLYSGGLDSFAGAAHDLTENDAPLTLVTAATSPALAAMQRRTVDALRALRPTGIRLLQVPVGVRAATIERLTGRREAPEPSQRTRGLVFIALGAVSAATAGASELRVYENGVGAMNLPLTEAQYGSQNTRAMRPETLAKASRLMSLILEREFAIANPSFATTKAEMCARLPEALATQAEVTVSCDTGLTHRATRVPLCGTCTSCLLRRQALRSGGLAGVDDGERPRYRVDVREVSDVGDERLRRLHYMLNQAAQMDRALKAPTPRVALLNDFPELARIWNALGDQGYRDPVALTERLFARYAAEWAAFDHPLAARYLSQPIATHAMA